MKVESVISTKAAVLQALARGPSYGNGLIKTLSRIAAVDPRPGTVYPALRALVSAGQVRCWPVVPGGDRGGRCRRYYELTAKGIAALEAQQRALALVSELAIAPAVGLDVALMAERIRRGSELSAFAGILRRGMLAARRRR